MIVVVSISKQKMASPFAPAFDGSSIGSARELGI